MTKEKSYKIASSVCCDSSFRLEGDTKDGTMYHVCNNCNKNCDIKLTEKKVKASKGDFNRGFDEGEKFGRISERMYPASKGQCKCRCHIESVNICCDECLENHNPPESKGECFCSYYDWNRGTPNKKCMVHNPPEQEERWDSTYLFHPDNHSLDSEPTESDKNMQWDLGEDWIIKLRMLSHQIKAGEKKWVDVENYIKANFISKEKIKRIASDLMGYQCGKRDCDAQLKTLLKSLGLGD